MIGQHNQRYITFIEREKENTEFLSVYVWSKSKKIFDVNDLL